MNESEAAIDLYHHDNDEITGLLNPDAKKQSKAGSIFKRCILPICIIGFLIIFYVLFGGLLFGLNYYFPQTPKRLIVISIDGYRWDYPQKYKENSPTINSLISTGVSAEFLKPCFPSLTVVNHYSIATGLYPESNNIVGNIMYDSSRQEHFTLSNKTYLNNYWWSGEPIWITAELQNIKSAIIQWIGAEVTFKNRKPFYLDGYDPKSTDSDRINKAIEYLDQPFGFEPKLIMAYVESLDKLQHKEGPDSINIPSKIKEIDDMIKKILEEIKEKKLENFVDVMIVSDHGSSNATRATIIHLDDLVPNFLERVHVYEWLKFNGTVTANIQPKNKNETMQIINLLREDEKLNCHLKHEIPERYHMKNNERVADIFCYAKLGYTLGVHDEGNQYEFKGDHGYDNEEMDMQGVFIANGPSFKSNFTMKSFENIQLYNVIANVLKINPQTNNGTIDKVKDIFK
eukprot:gene8643-590_t